MCHILTRFEIPLAIWAYFEYFRWDLSIDENKSVFATEPALLKSLLVVFLSLTQSRARRTHFSEA